MDKIPNVVTRQASDERVTFALISCLANCRHPDRHSGAALPSSQSLRAVGEDQRAKRGAEDTGAD